MLFPTCFRVFSKKKIDSFLLAADFKSAGRLTGYMSNAQVTTSNSRERLKTTYNDRMCLAGDMLPKCCQK